VAKKETSCARNSIWPTRKNISVPKNSSSSPAAGVTNATTGRTTLGAEGAAAGALAPKSVSSNWSSEANGCSRTESFCPMRAPISGARPIHSLIGPASAVAARLSPPTQSTTIIRAVIHGEMPRRLAAFTTGPSVRATMVAAKIGIRIGRQKCRAATDSSRKMPMIAALPADDHISRMLPTGCGSLIITTRRASGFVRIYST
jgi:hypothetical protein